MQAQEHVRYSSLLGSYDVSAGNQLPTRRSITILRNVDNYLADNTA